MEPTGYPGSTPDGSSPDGSNENVQVFRGEEQALCSALRWPDHQKKGEQITDCVQSSHMKKVHSLSFLSCRPSANSQLLLSEKRINK